MKSILIVDDESRLLQSIQAGLKSCQDKFSVLTALNGREAIDVLAGQQVDLVVTDLRMPEVDGFELLAHISQTYPFLPTIVMTAFATPEIEERISSAGSFVLLEKPLDFDRLAEAIGDGLEQSATVSNNRRRTAPWSVFRWPVSCSCRRWSRKPACSRFRPIQVRRGSCFSTAAT
jgi:DNA-binding NtrC family response regulator